MSNEIRQLIFFTLLIVGTFLMISFIYKSNLEKKRHLKAKTIELNRSKQNTRINYTDTYVYLIERKVKPHQWADEFQAKKFLKIGIGVEDRVKEQMRVPGTQLISL
jgi:hypothetical protein